MKLADDVDLSPARASGGLGGVECQFHPGAIRCAHHEGRYVVLNATKWPEIFEVTKGNDGRRGSITSPIDEAGKDWAFEERERQWLLEPSEPSFPGVRA